MARTQSGYGLELALNGLRKWIAKHPVLTATIIAAIVVAAVFTGGAVLAAPAALTIMASIGIVCGLAGALVLAGLAKRANPYENVSDGVADDMHQAGVKDKASLKTKLSFLSVASLLTAFSALIFPPLGIALCGIAAVLAGAGLVAGAGQALVAIRKEAKYSAVPSEDSDGDIYS